MNQRLFRWYWVLTQRLKSGGSSPPSPLLNNLVAYWKLDETSGTRFDSTANSNDLTDNNSVGSVTGVVGNAADFDGTNYLSAPNDSAFNTTGEFTVTVWIYSTIVTGAQGVVGVWHVGGRQWLIVRQSSLLRFYCSSTGINFTYISSPVPTNTWSFVAAGYDGSNIFISLNGGAMTTTPFTGPIYGASGQNLEVGAYFGGSYLFYGLIDEIGIWHRALTASEITQLYNSGNGLTYPFV